MKEMFRSVFDADYQGYEVFLDKVLKPLFGEQLEVLPVAEDNPTGVSEEAMEKARIKKIVRVANIAQTFNRDPMEVFDITLEDRVDITRARVGIQQIIRRGLFIHTHAFMLFHAEHPDGENWRFSYAHKLGTVGSMTDAKRYTYLFGENMHCRTAIDRFADLAKGEITNQKLLDAFNVEALSDEFFDEYRKHYAAFVKYITGKHFEKEGGKWVEKSGTPNEELMAQFGGDDKAVRDYVKKLMGRITFLHFLQKKGWMNWDVNYMQHLFEKSDKKDNFLEAVLEPLFFGVLNTKVQNRAALFKQRGWAFSLLDEWQDFPYLNGGLFEEDESDRLNVIFPESYFVDLFKFYARYNFTVDENDPDDAEVGVDPEMLGKIFENLLEDNKDKGAFYTPKEIVRYMCQESLTAYLVGKTGYDEELIRSFVIHPYDEVEKFDNQQQNAIYNALENVKICDPAIGSGAFPMGLLNELVRCEEALLGEREDDHQSRSGLKKYIIQNNIYGVDIEKGAIDIARLRFWLSIVVDEKEPSPLPNLDYKIMQGNSLLESYKKIDLSHLLTEEGIGEDMLGGLFANQDVIQDTREELAASLEAYFNCSDHEEKMRIQEDIRTIIKVQLSARNLNVDFGDIDVAANQEFFLWHTWFSDVFNRPSDCEKGFDIVIANPPYVDIKGMPQNEVRTYFNRFSTAEKRINLYALFIEFGFSLLSPNGILCYINPNSLLVNESYKKLREKIIDDVAQVIKLPDAIFKQAIVETMILLLIKGCNEDSIKGLYFKNNEKPTFNNLRFRPFSRRQWKQDASKRFNIFTSPQTSCLLRKIEDGSTPLSSYIDSSLGITPYDKAKGHTPQMIKDRVFHSESPLSTDYVPLIEGRNIHPYCVTNEVHEYLKYGPWLGAPREKRFFTDPRVIVRQIVGGKDLEIIAAYADREFYFTQIGFALIPKSHRKDDAKYFTALLNSKLISFYHKYTFLDPEKILFQKVLIANVKQLPIKVADTYQEIVCLVDCILDVEDKTSSSMLNGLQDKIDELVFETYGLSSEEKAFIKQQFTSIS